MKRVMIVFVAAVLFMTSMSEVSHAANSEPGGFKGLLSGCCFGHRVAGDYNELGTGKVNFTGWFLVGFCFGIRAQEDYSTGKDMTFRDWGRAIPYVNIVFAIWDGIDGANGLTRSDYQMKFGASYY